MPNFQAPAKKNPPTRWEGGFFLKLSRRTYFAGASPVVSLVAFFLEWCFGAGVAEEGAGEAAGFFTALCFGAAVSEEGAGEAAGVFVAVPFFRMCLPEYGSPTAQSLQLEVSWAWEGMAGTKDNRKAARAKALNFFIEISFK
jgi:hypothetical protein